MQSDRSAETLLFETPVPVVRGGLHRAALKRDLLARMQAENTQMMSAEPRRAESPSTGRRTFRMWWALAPVAAAVVVAAVAVFWNANRETKDPEPNKSVATAPPGTKDPVSSRPAMDNRLSERASLRRKSIAENVKEAEVIVVATATESELAPPNVPGDGPEKFVHLKVVRVLKGKLDDKKITVRTRNGEEPHVGKDWVVLLSADNLATKHLFSPMFTANVEAEVKAILAKDQKADEKIDAKKLIGKWTPKEGGDKGKLFFEFAKDGKLTLTTGGTRQSKSDGTYQLDGNKLTLTLNVGEREKKMTLTVTKLTDTELTSTGEDGKADPLVRVQDETKDKK